MTSVETDKIASIFNLYTKYRYHTFNNLISSDSQIYKFKERVNNYNKIFGEMEAKKFTQKEPESIQIMVKEGKERQQAIGFLEDGTTVIVEHAKNFIGKRVNVEITSSLHSSTNKMLFAKIQGQNIIQEDI